MEDTVPSGGKRRRLRAAWVHRAAQRRLMKWFHGTDQACVHPAVSWAGYFRVRSPVRPRTTGRLVKP